MNSTDVTLATGALAFYDTFAGLIPCKVTAIHGNSGPASSEQQVHFTLTADCGAYKKGEQLSAWALHVPPRSAIIRREYSMRIGFYTVQADE